MFGVFKLIYKPQQQTSQDGSKYLEHMGKIIARLTEVEVDSCIQNMAHKEELLTSGES